MFTGSHEEEYAEWLRRRRSNKRDNRRWEGEVCMVVGVVERRRRIYGEKEKEGE